MGLALPALALWAGCGAGAGDGESDLEPGPVGDTDTDLQADTDADTDDPTPPRAPVFTAGPELVQTTALRADLAWELTATTDLPTTLRVTTVEGPTTWVHEFGPATTSHDHWVLYWHHERIHEVTVEAISEDGGSVAASPITITAPPLPADFPDLSLPVVDTARMAPGVTVFGVSPVSGGDYYVVALDTDGQVVWWLSDPGSVHNFFVSQAGTIVLNSDKDGVWECGLDGAVLGEWHPELHGPQVGTIVEGASALHHDVIELPNGDFASLSAEHRTIAGYPTSETNPSAPTASAEVVGDQVVEFRRDGTVVHRHSLLDVLDPTRIGFDSVRGSYWDGYFPIDDPKDWSHANALVYDATHDQFLVSLRHQDAVVALDHETGALAWILGPHDNWGPTFEPYLLTPTTPGFTWQYHQHGTELSAAGTLTLFDNANEGASAYGVPLAPDTIASRGLEVTVDPIALTVAEVWSWGGELDPPIFSGSQGNVQRLTNGNSLIAYGNITMFGEPVPTARIFEVDPAGTVALQVDLGAAGLGPAVYRAKHWESLYPH